MALDDFHAFTMLPRAERDDDRRPANEQFRRAVHAYAGRPRRPMLEREQEAELLRRVQADPGDTKAISDLVEAYQGFLVTLSRRFFHHRDANGHADDYLAVATLSFIKLIRRPDFSIEIGRLSALASYTITGDLYDYHARSTKAYRLSGTYGAKTIYLRTNHWMARFKEEHGRRFRGTQADIEALADLAETSKNAVRAGLAAKQHRSIPLHHVEIVDHDQQVEGSMMSQSAMSAVQKAMARAAKALTPRDRDIMRIIVMEGEERREMIKTLAEKYDLTRERIRQIVRANTALIRDLLRQDGITNFADAI